MQKTRVIFIASGKGGVGKSTVTAGLARALRAAGKSVGVCDADIYGPSQPYLFGMEDYKLNNTSPTFTPAITKEGIRLMSVAFLLPDADTPLAWRGPMLHKLLAKFFQSTNWGDLDYLLVDLPPGTGDVTLSLAQLEPATEAIIVTTPGQLAMLDVSKAIRMFQKVHIPIRGVIENMATYTCPHGEEVSPFGESVTAELHEKYRVEVIGRLPFEADQKNDRSFTEVRKKILFDKKDEINHN